MALSFLSRNSLTRFIISVFELLYEKYVKRLLLIALHGPYSMNVTFATHARA